MLTAAILDARVTRSANKLFFILFERSPQKGLDGSIRQAVAVLQRNKQKRSPLCCDSVLAVHRHACASAHDYAVQKGDVWHAHGPQLVIECVLGSEEAAQHFSESQTSPAHIARHAMPSSYIGRGHSR